MHKSDNKRSIEQLIKEIEQMKSAGIYEKYIEYITFPCYKNLMPKSTIHFEFPYTALVGKNGSGKSSTLHALYGAVYWHSCSDFWFSTEVDPIKETQGEGKNRFFYGYKENKDSEVLEVMKTRMKRGSETKDEDPDYWETSRPIKKDGMSAIERNLPVKRDVVYIDFRAEVSAFDKVYHFSKGEIPEKKDFLRKRSKYLNRLFSGERMRFPGKKDEAVGTVTTLDKTTRDIIGEILGKNYADIKIAQHKIFRTDGTSIYVKTLISTNYSEANAGSGEVAVIQLVKKIQDAKDYSLILLDEPEVSIHPAAQEKLKVYLLEAIKQKKLQVVLSTHSTILVRDMPTAAIKLYVTNHRGKFEIHENVSYQEAFFDLEARVSDKKLIYCEDFAAKQVIEKLLEKEEKTQYFQVNFVTGGEKTLLKKHIPSFVSDSSIRDKVFLVLDSDMRTGAVFDESKLTVAQSKDPVFLGELVKKIFGVEIDVYPDGGDGGERNDQKCKAYFEYLRFSVNHLFYLPNLPELILLNSNYAKIHYSEVLNSYDSVTNENCKEVILSISQYDFGDETHTGDVLQRLAYQWSKESNDNQEKIIKIINDIFLV